MNNSLIFDISTIFHIPLIVSAVIFFFILVCVWLRKDWYLSARSQFHSDLLFFKNASGEVAGVGVGYKRGIQLMYEELLFKKIFGFYCVSVKKRSLLVRLISHVDHLYEIRGIDLVTKLSRDESKLKFVYWHHIAFVLTCLFLPILPFIGTGSLTTFDLWAIVIISIIDYILILFLMSQLFFSRGCYKRIKKILGEEFKQYFS